MRLTFVVLVALVCLATMFAPRWNRKRKSMFSLAVAVACVAFIPSCVLIQVAIDKVRFGEFEYSSAADIHDRRVDGWMPRQASNIRLFKHAGGFQAKYQIEQAELEAFIDREWKEWGRYSVVSRSDIEQGRFVSTMREDFRYPPETGSDTPLKTYSSPVAADGAGFTIWYDPETATAYQEAGYW
ncbi:hypothetical protein [Aeoliella mucimassa]|nr:hypothetical protein [Aeoliella mucimassa]